jgi:hypothetical protein
MITDTISPRNINPKQVIAIMAASLYKDLRQDYNLSPEERAALDREALLQSIRKATELYNLVVDVTNLKAPP